MGERGPSGWGETDCQKVPARMTALPVTTRPAAAGRHNRLLVLATAVLVLLAGLLVNPGGATPAHASTLESAMTADINAARAAHGLPALHVAADLVSVARSHSAAMASSHTLFHTPNLTSAICCWLAVGENVGEGGSVSAVNSAFLASAPHRANILDSRYTQVGVGIVVDSSGTLWITEDFRKPNGSSSSSPAPAPARTPSTHASSTPSRTPTRAAQQVSRSSARAPLALVLLDRQITPGYRDPLRAAEEFCRVMATAAKG